MRPAATSARTPLLPVFEPVSLQPHPPPAVSPGLAPLLDEVVPASDPPLLESVPASDPPLLDVPASLVVPPTHLPPVHVPLVQSVPAVQASPLPFLALQIFGFAAVSQKLDASQSVLVEQALSHLPPVQLLLVHCSAAVHAPPASFLFAQSLVCVSQNCVAEQSAVVAQVVPQAPDVALQMGPAWVAPAQSAFVVHLPHVPSPFTYGFAVVGQGNVALVPLSPLAALHEPSAPQAGFAPVAHARVAPDPKPPLQAAHLPCAVSQRGFVPVHNAPAVAEHSVHCPLNAPAS